MKKMKRFLSLLLCLCTMLSVLSTGVSAASYVDKITVTVTAPVVGDKPANAKTASTASSEVVDTQWDGELDANGRFKAGVKYTITVTVGMKEEYDEKYFKKSTNPNNYTINGNRATVVSHGYTEVVLRYTFKEAAATKTLSTATYTIAAPVAGEMPTYMEDSDRLYRTREWLGNFNADGSFKAGETYTARMTLTAKDPSTTVLKYTSGEKITVNGYPTDLVSTSATSVTFQFRFAPVAAKVAAVPDEGGVLRDAQFFYVPALPGDKPSYDVTVAQSDALEVSNVKWTGDFDENGCFIAKNDYRISFTVKVKDGVNMTIPSGSAAQPRNFTLNGSTMTTGAVSSDGKAYAAGLNVPVKLPSTVVDVTEVFTLEQADAVDNALNGKKYRDLILDNEVMANLIQKHRLNIAWAPVDEVLHLDIPEVTYATRLLVDYPADHEGHNGSSGKALDYLPNLTELWLSPDMDAEAWMGKISDHTPFGFEGTDRGPNSWNFTIYISSKKYPNGVVDKYGARYQYPFRVLLYDGDVYTAFEKAGKGEAVGREWCHNHKYTSEIRSPDRIMKYPTCQNATWYCYSCYYCGKPEYNINHVFKTRFNNDNAANDVSGSVEHSMTQVIDPKHLVGKNADGDLVYAESCIWCGANQMQVTLLLDLTEAEFKYHYSGSEYSLKQYQETIKESWDKSILPRILTSTVEEPQIGYFVVDADKVVTAKTASWATGEVTRAAQNDLIDSTLLGNNYTEKITRLQFCSVAIKMAEKMLGKELPASPASTFTDTDNIYVLKAHKAGIVNGRTATTFDPNGKLDREQMATFIYRTLMFVRNNSNIRFTVYDSMLAKYTDSKQISSWAKDSFEFMNALGLIKGNSATTLNPKGSCTIQEALIAAYRSLSADKIGWYQAIHCYWDGDAYFLAPHKYMFVGVSHAIGDRVWVYGTVDAVDTWLKVDSRDSDYTNTPMYLRASDFKPIKELKENDTELFYQYVPG